MTDKVSTMDVRQRIGDMLNRVALRHDEFIIERKGKPLAAFVPLERLQQMRRFARRHALEFMDQQQPSALTDAQSSELAADAKRWARRRRQSAREDQVARDSRRSRRERLRQRSGPPGGSAGTNHRSISARQKVSKSSCRRPSWMKSCERSPIRRSASTFGGGPSGTLVRGHHRPVSSRCGDPELTRREQGSRRRQLHCGSHRRPRRIRGCRRFRSARFGQDQGIRIVNLRAFLSLLEG